MDPTTAPLQTPHQGTSYRNQPYHATPATPVLQGNDGSQFGAHHGAPPTPWGAGGYAPTPGRFTPWSADKVSTMQARLARRLGPEFVTTRPGPGGGPKLSYIEGWKVVNLANEVFGFNGWSSSITSLKTDFLDVNAQDRCWVGITAIIRVTLQDGCFHEDIGYGHAENVKGKHQALEKAQKEAVTDGVKRALKHFGNVLGNCLYDKEYTKEVGKIRVPPAKFNVDELERRPEFTPQGATRPTPAPQHASAVPPHVSGNAKPPAPPVPAAPAPRPVERHDTPLRSIEDEDMNVDDSEFSGMGESFLDDFDESVLTTRAGKDVPMLGAAKAAAPVNDPPQYQHRHRPDMPTEPRALPVVRHNSSSSESSSGAGDGQAKRQVGGFAMPRGAPIPTATTTASASRRAAMMAAISAGASSTDSSNGQTPRIPSGGIDAVAVRAQSNLQFHSANLEIENGGGQIDVTSVKYSAFTSARGVKREGSQSPTKRDSERRAAMRVALSEVPAQQLHTPDTTDWKRSRLM